MLYTSIYIRWPWLTYCINNLKFLFRAPSSFQQSPVKGIHSFRSSIRIPEESLNSQNLP